MNGKRTEVNNKKRAQNHSTAQQTQADAKAPADTHRLLNEEQRYAREERKKQIKKIKRRRSIIAICGVLVIVFAVLAVLSQTVLFKVNSIEIENSKVYTKDEILKAINFKAGEDNLFRIDMEEFSEEMQTKLPYIESVKVVRKLPNTLKVTVTEAKARVMYAESEKVYWILSKSGKVLEKTAENEKLISLLCGKPAKLAVGENIEFEDTEKMNNYKTVLNAIDETGFEKVTVINVTNTKRIVLSYENRIKMIVGKPEGIIKKLNMAKKSIELEDNKRKDKKASGNLDLSIDGKAFFNPEN